MVCTSDLTSPIAAIKAQSNATATGTGNMLGTGATTGEYTADLSICDEDGNCTSAGTETFSLDSIIGQGDSTGQSDATKGNDDLYMSSHNFAQRQADKPSWDAQFMGGF